MEFEWNPEKAAANLRKHKVSFAEASTVFGDPLSITVNDSEHSAVEVRSIIVGLSRLHRLLLVSFAERGDRFRIISARELTRKERKVYEEKIYK